MEVIGSLRKPKQASDCLEITDCILFGAGYDPSNNSLIEPIKPYIKLSEIYIYPRRKVLKSATAYLFPLFYQSTLDSREWRLVASIEFESTLPQNHWILRGVKLITSEHWQQRFPNIS